MKPVRLSCGCGLYNDITLSFVEIYRAAVFQFCLCKWQMLKMTGIVIFYFFYFFYEYNILLGILGNVLRIEMKRLAPVFLG